MINVKKFSYIFMTTFLLISSPVLAETSENDKAIEAIDARVSSGYIDPIEAVREEPGKITGNIIVTGDSYGGYFVNYLRNFGYNVDKNKYNRAQKSVLENEDIYRLAFITNYDNVVLSIGVNDYLMQTPVYAFANVIENLASLGLHYDKKLYLHSYLSIPIGHENPKYTTDDYDIALRQIAAKYDNVEYIDVLSYGCKQEYLMEDNIHYNSKFYEALYNKLCTYFTGNKTDKIIMTMK